jgi:hypothetical protein
MILLLATSWAHHGTAVGQVTLPPSVPTETTTGAALSVAAAYEGSAYHRVLRGSEQFSGNAAEVDLHVLSVTPRWSTRTGWFVEGRLPMGVIRTASDDASQTHTGLSDVALRGGRVGRSAGLRVGVTAPTGLYQAGEGLQFTDVAAVQGELLATTYDTRASLGSGAWGADLAGSWSTRGQTFVQAAGSWSQPLHSTTDGIAWGATGLTTALVGRSSDRWRIQTGPTLSHHAADHRWADDDTGDVTRQAFGRRTALGLALRAEARLSERLRCQAGVHVPLWRRVQGVQVVESASLTVGCTPRYTAP